MRVLVVGGQGQIGRRLIDMLRQVPWAQAVGASARPAPPGQLELDLADRRSVAAVFGDFDVVVHCPPGPPAPRAIEAQAIASACSAAGVSRLVFVSGLDVYGRAEGLLPEHAMRPGEETRASDAQAAEARVAEHAAAGFTAVILRPGPMFGAVGTEWVEDMARWLRSGRMGDLGARGDGWSNLVHVDDVCRAIIQAMRLELPAGQVMTYNLAAPDSPRWNAYIVDLAQAIGATPVRRIAKWQQAADAYLLSPLLQRLDRRAGRSKGKARPQPWVQGRGAALAQQLRVDPRAASRDLKIDWTPYSVALHDCADWLSSQTTPRSAASKPGPRRAAAAFK